MKCCFIDHKKNNMRSISEKLLQFLILIIMHISGTMAFTQPGEELTRGKVSGDADAVQQSPVEAEEHSGHIATLDEMIGQMIMVGIRGKDLAENPLLLTALQEGKAGGIILFEKNLSAENTSVRLQELIKGLQASSKHPLLIAIDQEGGRVNRLKARYGFPDSKSATWLGNVNHQDTTSHYAEQIASTLCSLGININFAPVVDLCSNPNNPVIAAPQRCFSGNPQTVTRHAGWFIDAHHKYNILTTLKHFPGHGSSTKDTHKEMTDVTRLWDSSELLPYKGLISQNKADAIMTAHIVNCKLDKECLPATLSKTIITGLLRDSLKFNGVVFTDDMQMHAITKHYGLEQSILLAINAGVDILLYSNNIAGSREHQATVVHRIIKDMVSNGMITEERIRTSYKRITDMKKTVSPEYQFPAAPRRN